MLLKFAIILRFFQYFRSTYIEWFISSQPFYLNMLPIFNLISMSYFYMFFEITQIGTTVSTALTFIWFLSRMFSYVGSHIVYAMRMVVTFVATHKFERLIRPENLAAIF